MHEKTLAVKEKQYGYFSLKDLLESMNCEIDSVPVSIKILLENIIRKNDTDLESIKALVHYKDHISRSISFYPSRVLMQDFTGVPAIVDLATMRNAMSDMNKDVMKINPMVKVDLVIDHSVQVDFFGEDGALKKNVDLEIHRNIERYKFLKWGQQNLKNFRVVPPGTGICHQVNIEYLADVVTLDDKNCLFFDTVVGTDSHTTMVNALGVLGWGVGGIEAESVMLGQPMSIVIPEVIGVKLINSLSEGITATDLVLYITHVLRNKKVVNKFVEFYGEGVKYLTVADRATIANMAPECGSTCNIFPIDEQTLEYLSLTARSVEHIEIVESYAKAQGLWHDINNDKINFTDTIVIDLSTIEASMAGPKRPQDNVVLSQVPDSFYALMNKNHIIDKKDDKLRDGSIVIAAITSCTNTSNPDVMIAAGLVAKKAVELGIQVKPWVKTSLAPGSQVVTEYLNRSGLYLYLEKLGFNIVGYGCTTCIGNSGPLDEQITQDILDNNLVVSSILSGNRNFEGRIHQLVKANYLASPPLVVIYALCGFIDKDITTEHIAIDKDGNKVYCQDLFPSNEEIKKIVNQNIDKNMFADKYSNVFEGGTEWNNIHIDSTNSTVYPWDDNSTYVRKPNYFDDLQSYELSDIRGARILMVLGDSITTDHISPAGQISPDSAAGIFLQRNGTDVKNFNSYGSRRGNHEVMIRGTFANIRVRNLMLENVEGGYSRLYNSTEVKSVYDVAMEYKKQNIPLIVFAGEEYGTGSSRDWAAKGTRLLGVKAVVAKSFERIHRSNLVGMGVLPFIIDSTSNINITGNEEIDILFDPKKLQPNLKCQCIIKSDTNKHVNLILDVRTESEIQYLNAGGILQYALKKLSI